MAAGTHELAAKRAAPEPVSGPATEPGADGPIRPSVAVAGLARAVQAKLEVGASGDPLEAEADVIAQRVVEAIRRHDSAPGEDETLEPALVGPRLDVMRRAEPDPAAGIGPEGGPVSAGLEALLTRQSAGGQPLPARTRGRMEAAMGADFSDVRVHAGPEAAALNRQLSARAFTHENHVFFRDGIPDASSAAGQHLLAHELAHTLQQRPGMTRRSVVQREGEDEGGGGTGVMYLDPGGVGHKEPDKTKTPGVIYLDPHGVGHKEPDKAPKLPGIVYLDPHGVGHKEPDKAPKLPPVLHLDDKGVAHTKADHVRPSVATAHKAIKNHHDLYVPQARTAKDVGAKWNGFKAAALARRQEAAATLQAAAAVWDVEAADSGLIVAQQAALAKTANTAAAKAKADAQALVATYDPARLHLSAQDLPLTANAAKFKTDKPRWLKNVSPMTKTALDEIQALLDEQLAERTDANAVENARVATLASIDQSATEADVDAKKTSAPLAKVGALYAINGMLQQKLNMANGGQRIAVTALFDANTEVALKKFQKDNALPETGIADVATWTALNAAAPSAERNGKLRVEDPDKSATVRPDAGVHPELSFPATGAAVRELQTRLNSWHASVVGKKPFSTMSVDGIFGIKTRSAVKAFQKAHGLKEDAVVADDTWAELDKVGAVSKGVREFETTQICEGMLTGGQAHYDWEVTKDNRLVITVKINFTGEKKHPKVAAWLQDITDVWNGFKAVEDGGIREYDIEFKPVVSSKGHHKVKVGKPTKSNPNPRSDSGNWYVNDGRKGLAPHEFGHLVGLDDEYNRPEEQYVETTGQEPTVGKLTATTGKNSTAVANLIDAAFTATAGQPGREVSKAIAKIVKDEGLAQGGYARLVAQRYLAAHPFEPAFLNDIQGSAIPATFTSYLAYKGGYDWTSDLTRATQVFSESNTSIMGTMTSVPDNADAAALAGIAPHDHPVQPRHLRSFTELLVVAMPGTRWKTKKR